MCNCNDAQTIRIMIGGCGCNQGCGCQPDPIDEDDIGLPDEPPDDPQPSPSGQCNAAHFMAVTLRNQLNSLAGGTNQSYPTFREQWVSSWNVLPAIPTPPNFGAWNLMLAYVGGMDVPGFWDIIHNNLVCSLYQADSLYDALERVRSFAESLPTRAKLALRIMATYVDYDILFNPLAVLPVGYENRSCCGQTVPPPPEPGEEPPPAPEPGDGYYYIVLPLQASMVEDIDETNSSGNVSGNLATMTPSGSIPNLHHAKFVVSVEDAIAEAEVEIEPGETIAGVVGMIASTTSAHNNVSDQIRVNSFTGGNAGWLISHISDGRYVLWHSSESVPPPAFDGTPEFQDWVSDNFAGNNILTSPLLLFDDNKASFTLWSLSEPDDPAAVLSASVWIVFRVDEA